MVQEGGFTNLATVLKGKIPVIYRRVSSAEQKSKGQGLNSQNKAVKDFLKDVLKNRRKPIDFKEQISGGKAPESRKAFNEMIGFLLDQENPSDYFVILRDFTRWSRHAIYGPWALRALYDAGVEVVSVIDNASTGHRSRPDPNGEFLFSLWMGLGGRERTGGAERTAEGIALAKTKGRVGGQPLDLSKPWEVLYTILPGLNTPKGMPGHIGQLQATREYNMPRTWLRKAKVRLNELDNWGEQNDIPDAVLEWLEVLNWLRETEAEFGSESDQFRAVRAQTSGFMKKPIEFWPFKLDRKSYLEIVNNPQSFVPKS